MMLPGESDTLDQSDRLLPPHGGYRRLRSFQTAQLVYDGTVLFCERFIERRSRTRDQMVQAARSGRQNIAEGSMASATSKKTELKLTNVAKASLEELLLDYEDFLRQRRLRLWDKNDPEALAVRARYQVKKSEESDRSDSSDDVLDPHGIETAELDVAANTLICLINQATFLLKRQIEKLERAFVEQGGFTERLYHARTRYRRAQDEPDDPVEAPQCPRYGQSMKQRTARQGPHAGQAFLGVLWIPELQGHTPHQQIRARQRTGAVGRVG